MSDLGKLNDRIAQIRDRALNQLDTAHDYYVFTIRLWGHLQSEVEQNQATLIFHNASTNTTVDQHGLLIQAQRYKSWELPASTIQQFVSIFEVFFFDVLREWFLVFPQEVYDKQISGREIASLTDKNAIIEVLIQKELISIAYQKPADWFAYLSKRTGVDFKKADSFKKDIAQPFYETVEEFETVKQAFCEIKATRDVLIHANGVVNAQYLEKAGPAARVAIGQRLDIGDPYHQQSWELISCLIEDIGNKLIQKAT